MKDSFILYTKYEEQISLLSDVQAGVLLRALLCYQLEKSLPEMDSMTNLVFTVIRQDIDCENQKYDDIRKARKSAGAKGGRPLKRLVNKGEKAKKANGFEEKAKKANGCFVFFEEGGESNCFLERETFPNEKESNKEKDNTLERENKRKKEIDKDIISTSACACEEEDELKSHEDIMQEWELSSGLTETMKEFLRHCYINGHVVSNAKLEDILLRLCERFTDDKAKIDCVTNAIRGGYMDIKA